MVWNCATALDAFKSSDLLEVGMSANHVRHNLHPEPVVTYELCGQAASLEEAVRESALHGSVSVSLEQICDMEHISPDALSARLVAQREKLSEVTFQHLRISSLKATAGNVLALSEALPELQGAGLRSIKASFHPAHPALSRREWSALLQAAAEWDLVVSASITIGNAESLDDRVAMLTLLRELQEGSHAIHAVLVRVHHAADPDARREEEATAVDYLKTLAITRLFLDNIDHVQTDWSIMGPKVLELALRFGADDAGAIPWSRMGTAEPSHHGGESELRRIIRDAGFRPVERDALFRQHLLH
jgi:cyclic dehypoxanthinyl futalosine synthase